MQLEQTRGRQSRAEEQLPERRKRTETDMTGKRLAVRNDLLDFDKFKYRYINDSDTRLYQLTRQDDWEVMTQDGQALKPDSTDMGSAVSIPVGTRPDGSPMRAYLCRKLRRFYEDDQKMKQTELDEQLAQLRLGNSAKGEGQGDYVPSGGIRIAR
jgi:hypothetical protein